jgi:hypothetical protein
VALMVRVGFDSGQVDLAGAVFDVHADIGLVGGDDLPAVRVEGAGMKRALGLLVPLPDRGDIVARGGFVQLTIFNSGGY